MEPTVIVGILSFAGTVAGSLCGILAANKLVVYRIEQLEKKVDKHNHVIERMTIVENEIQRIDEKYDEKIADLKKARAI